MKKKIIKFNTSKAIILPSSFLEGVKEVEMDIDSINKKIIISW